jgi:sugar/nucleoside kinase (ribokinase family)
MNGSSQPDLDVIVVGNAGIDTSIYLPGGEPDLAHESTFSLNLDCVGQAGGYSARGYAQLGWRTGFIGAVGDDRCGWWVRYELARDGVDLAGLFGDPAGTARSVNLMSPDGRRRNFYDGKGHVGLAPDLARCTAVLRRARLAHVHLPDWARHLLAPARAAGLVVACDLQDVVDPDDPYRRDFVEAADVLFFSAVNHADPEPLIRRFLAGRADRIVVAGMGAAGCALGTRDGVRRFPAVDGEHPVVDTNGAGDGLAVGFLTSLVLEKRPLEDCVLRGQIAARHTCTLRADSTNLIRRDALELRWRELCSRSA